MKAKKIIITVAFALLMLGLKAQEKYEYTTIIYHAGTGAAKYFISISRQGKFEESSGKVSEGTADENLSPVLEIVNKMSNEGWEVYANSTDALNNQYRIHYFL